MPTRSRSGAPSSWRARRKCSPLPRAIWRSVKYEEVYLYAYETVSAVRAGLGRYFTFFNQRRPHDALRRRTPDAVYSSTLPQKATAEPRGTVLIPAA